MKLSFLPVALLTLITMLVLPSGSAAGADQALPAGTPMLGASPLDALAASISPGPSQTSKIIENLEGPFSRALQVEIKVQPANPWNIQLVARTTEPIAAGDVLHMTFYMRTLAATDGVGRTEFIFERSSSPWEKWASFPAQTTIEGGWQRFDVPFTVGDSYPAGGAAVTMRLGYTPQTIQIADVQLTNYRNQVTIDQLQRTALGYPGQALDAPWRQAAHERITEFRTSDLEVYVVDRDGQPISGADVAVQMQRHAFPFGTAVYAQRINNPLERRYRDEITKLFNAAVIGNALKWTEWERWGQIEAPRALEWLRDHDIIVRGHTLVWPSWKFLPEDVQRLKDDPEALQSRIIEHITSVVGRFKGQLVNWDVVNEPYANHDLQDLLGLDAMVEWFQAAHAADPDAGLFVNDYNILAGGGLDHAHQNAYFELIEYLLEHGAPISGIGMQSHFNMTVTPPERLLEILDRFSTFGLPIWITEFDHQINATDSEEQLRFQADYLRDFYTTAFSHPSVEGIIMWSFQDADWDGWLHNAPIYNKDGTLKPSGQMYMDLVFDEWWTEVRGKTDTSGRYSARAFLGDYKIEVRFGDRTAEVETKVERGGTQVTIKLGE